MDVENESYLLLLLSDGNLPTGSFVASAGLESFVKHGFFSLPHPDPSDAPTIPRDPVKLDHSPPALTRSTINFVRDSVHAYAHNVLPFIKAVYDVCSLHRAFSDSEEPAGLEQSLQSLKEIDDLYESMTLNHVAKRASTAQGVAHLTLLSKGFVRPSWLPDDSPIEDRRQQTRSRNVATEALADELKRRIRKGDMNGHLPICWGVMTVALGLSCGT